MYNLTKNNVDSKYKNQSQPNLEPNSFDNAAEANIKVEYSDETFDQTRPYNNLNSKKTVLIFNFDDNQDISNLNQTFENSKLKIITCELILNRPIDNDEHKTIKEAVFSIINTLNNKNNEKKTVNIQTDEISIISLEEYNVFKIMSRNNIMKVLSHILVTQKNANYSLVNNYSQNTTKENILNSNNESRCEAVFKQSEKNKSIIMGVYNSVIKEMLHPAIENEENMKTIFNKTFTLVSQCISEYLNNKMPNFTINSPDETSCTDFNKINITINMNDETRHLLSQHIHHLQEFRQNQQIGYQFSTEQQHKQEPQLRMPQFNNRYAQVQGVGMYNTNNWPRGNNPVAANVQVPTPQPNESHHTGFLQAIPCPKGQTRRSQSLGDFSGNKNNYNNQRQHPYRNQNHDLARPPGAQGHYDSNNNVMALHQQQQQLQQNAMLVHRNNNWQQQYAAGRKQYYIMPHKF